MAGTCACGCGRDVKEGNKYLHGHNSRVDHPMKGRKHSEETRIKLSKSHVGQRPWIAGRTHSEETRKRLSASHKGIKQSAELIAKRVASRAGYHHSEETLRKIGAGNKGKVVSEEARKKNSKSNKGRRRSPGTEFTSKVMKERYSDPAYIEKMKAAWNMKPNKAETFLMNLLDRLYPGEWKYTGDFSMTINGKCPDFVNCNGQKKIIEYFGDYWHQGHDPKERAESFAPFGYKTLVIWGSEMKNMDVVINRIHAFMEA